MFRPVLALSLALNVALGVAWLWRGRRADVPEGAAARVTPQPAQTTSTARAHAASLELAALAPEALRDRLRALGLPPAVVAELVRARAYARWEARTSELVRAVVKAAPLWRLTDLRGDTRRILGAAERKELHDLETAARNEVLRLLGPEGLDPSGQIVGLYGFLPPEKAIQLEALERDYRLLRDELRSRDASVLTPGDRARGDLLNAERERDFAALLTPAEREAWELRFSPTASALGPRMAGFEPTEAEYRAIFDVQQAFREKAPLVPMAGMGMVQRQRVEDQPELMAQLRTALGDARFADWELSGQIHMLTLASTARYQRDLPPATVREIATAVGAVATASERIAADPALTPDERREAITRLAATTRANVTAQLGSTFAEQYFRSVFWWQPLEQGGVVRYDGRTFNIRYGGNRPPPSAPSPAPAR